MLSSLLIGHSRSHARASYPSCVTAYPPRSRRGVFLLLTLKSDEVRFGVQKFWEMRSTGEGRDNENTHISSNIGVTAYGVRPDGVAAKVAGADERTADGSAGEREEHAPRARVEQAAGKT